MIEEIIKAASVVPYFKHGIQRISLAKNIPVSPLVVDYLAATLSDYLKSESLFRSFRYGPMEETQDLEPLTMMAAGQSDDNLALKKLKAQIVGNECLLLISFFYEFLLQKRGTAMVRHYGNLGSEAYQLRAELAQENQPFIELARKFWDISEVIRDLDQNKQFQNQLIDRHQAVLLGKPVVFH